MKFNEEDGIITADMARLRANNVLEDANSIKRHDIRTIMGYVLRSSGVGYNFTSITSQCREMADGVKEELEKLGYKVAEDAVPDWHDSTKFRYHWTISW